MIGPGPRQRILVPQFRGVYSSFPTVVDHEDTLFMFYRQGVTARHGHHGTHGRVRCLEFGKAAFREAFEDGAVEGLYGTGRDSVLFVEGNEFDAIASRVADHVYTLATRSYVGQVMRTYLSVSDTPCFTRRREVTVPGVQWLAFYGKGLACGDTYVLPAYGWLEDDRFDRPLLIATSDFETFSLLSALPSRFGGVILNESSLVHTGREYVIFMRQDSPPFGIWYATSHDLEHWSPPKRLLFTSHAPMALSWQGHLFLSYRFLKGVGVTCIGLNDLAYGEEAVIDEYRGNPYDGGYTDLAVIDGDVFLFYYIGNDEGEPFIKCCMISDDASRASDSDTTRPRSPDEISRFLDLR